MKKLIYCIALMAGTATVAFPQAHSSHARPPQHNADSKYMDSSRRQGTGAHEGMAEKRASMLSKELSLTSDQTSKVQALFTQQEKDMEAGWKNRSQTADTAAAHKNMKAMYEKNQQDLKAILTPPQIAKLDTLNAARKNNFMYNRDQYMGHGQGGPRGHGQKK